MSSRKLNNTISTSSITVSNHQLTLDSGTYSITVNSNGRLSTGHYTPEFVFEWIAEDSNVFKSGNNFYRVNKDNELIILTDLEQDYYERKQNS